MKGFLPGLALNAVVLSLTAQHGVGQTTADPPVSEITRSLDGVPAEFLRLASDAASRYQDRKEAIADGYRRLGPDFPGMGVHWVHTGRVVSGRIDAERPPILDYVDVDGVATLVAMAYTLPLGSDASPPAEPFGRDAWHDHSGEVNEESLLLNHPASASGSTSGFRLSMVHVWLPLSNPAGILEQNNWKLPFLRAGLEPPNHPSSLAGRGLSLASRQSRYYAELFYWAGELTEAEGSQIDGILESHSEAVDRWISDRMGHAIDAAGTAQLEAFWRAFWSDLERALDPVTFARIRPLREGHQ